MCRPLPPMIAFALCLSAAPAPAAEPTAREVFERRLAPIFQSPSPSSCVQCHLSGVDLKDYILPDHEKTFRSLRDQGLIDLDKPRQSKILRLIDMGANDRRPAAAVPSKVRAVEREAFAAWIAACAADPALRNAPKLDEKDRARPAAADAAIRHARKDRLLASFEQNVWALRFRCMNCHTEGTPQCEKLRKDNGDRVAWFKKAGPEATMDYLLASKLIDLADPDKSLLLRKPLKEVEHGGGLKFARGDQGHRAFKAWVEDAAAVKGGKVRTEADVPKPEAGPLQFGSDLWLKLTDTPPAWGDKLLQVTVYAWDAKAKDWEREPVATSDRVVWGKGKLWQHSLTLLAAPGSARAKAWKAGKPSLPPGRYRVKVHVDAGGRLAKDAQARMGPGDYAGQAEFQARWAEGYNAMTAVPAATVKE